MNRKDLKRHLLGKLDSGKKFYRRVLNMIDRRKLLNNKNMEIKSQQKGASTIQTTLK